MLEFKKFESPRRKLMGGPVPTGASNTHNFVITNSFSREKEKGIDSLRKAMIAMENLLLEGNLSIVSSIETNKTILCIKYTEDFENVAAGFSDGAVRLFKYGSGEIVRTLCDAEIQDNVSPVTCIQHRPLSKNYPTVECLTCTYANGCVKNWNYNYEKCNYTIREKRQTYGITYHPRLPKFITYGDDLRIYMYDEETRTQERILSASELPGSLDGHASRIFSACFNPRSNHELITGGWDDVVYFWDLRQPHALRHLSQIHICGQGLDISPRGTEILACSWRRENCLQLYDYATGELIVTMEPDIHESMLYCGKFLDKNFATVGGSDANSFRVIDLQSYASVATITGLSGGVYDIDIGPPKKTKKSMKDVPRSKLQELISLPRLAFVAGNKLYQVDFI